MVNLIAREYKARDNVGMTQKQLSEATGIYQADISKIERGLANPSLSTLKRLADGMGLKLQIEFVSKENKFFEDTMQGLVEAVVIEKNSLEK